MPSLFIENDKNLYSLVYITCIRKWRMQFIRVKNLPMQQVRNPRIFFYRIRQSWEALPVYSLTEQTFILGVATLRFCAKSNMFYFAVNS
jgi:hypothetical protein